MNFVPCQLAMSTAVSVSRANWLFEPKYDGYRAQIHVRADGLRLFTRGGLDWTARFSNVLSVSIPMSLVGSIVDAEICALDAAGRPDFALLGRSFRTGNAKLAIFAFDLLADCGVAIRNLPLIQRKERLRAVVRALGSPDLRYVDHTHDGAALMKTLRSAAWEGVMAKDPASPYLPGVRSPAWRKIKFKRRQEFVVAGWRPDPVTSMLKSIAIATHCNGGLRYHGCVASGFSAADRIAYAKMFAGCPTAMTAPVRAGTMRVVWLEPRFVAEVEFLEMAPSGSVRCGAFIGMREDKPAADVMLDAA